MEAFAINTVELIILLAAGLFFIIQLIYYFGLYNRIYTRHKADRKDSLHFNQEFPPISVVICARNEADNLRRYLPVILEQDYPQFEVIVINDASTDETDDLLTAMEEKYPHLYHSFNPESARYISRKKLGLTLGIKASKYNWLVFTEADCCPVSSRWLQLLARNFSSRTQIVLGYSGYERGKGWLHRKIEFSNLFHSMRYLGAALAGIPYMGIGRNMAYRKELFFGSKGYSTHLNLQRGEDDLFINEAATKENTRVETNPDAVVRVEPVQSYKNWKEEQVSYLATSRYFQGSKTQLMGFESFSRLLFHGACIAAIVLGVCNLHWLALGIAVCLWLVRYALQAMVVNKTATCLGEKRRYYLSLPLFDFQQPLQTFRFKLYRMLRRKGDFMRR